MSNSLKLYAPKYTLAERVERFAAISKTLVSAYSKIKSAKNKPGQRSVFGASVEITDQCNAGCQHCYVYDETWDQNKRIRGYLELEPNAHRLAENRVFDTFNLLHKAGIVHVTLIGGEPLLFSKAIYEAGQLFPIVWVVTNGTVIKQIARLIFVI
jgi:molybdenum cofactor biosynthesis enzyme MoaA